MTIRMLFEENKFIKLSKLSPQLLKQYIENDNYKFCFAPLLSQNNFIID